MQRLTAADFDQELLILFDAYVHGGIDRRGFLDRAQKFAVGGVTASMLLASLSPNFAAAQVVPRDDKRIKTEMLTYASPAGHGTMKGYLAMPANAAGKLPGVLVVRAPPEISLNGKPDRLSPGAYRGLTSEARRLGMPIEGHVPLALSPDLVITSGQRLIDH